MYVRFTPGDLGTQIEILEDNWKQVSQGTPLEWRFLDDNLDQLYRSEEKLSFMIQIFATLTISLACLGLYGIVTFMINNRIKEVGVRKVLGASIRSIYGLLIKKYLFLVLLAMTITLPLVLSLLNNWLEDFAYHIHINWSIYPFATLLLILMILITITFEVLKVARANPTILLRNE